MSLVLGRDRAWMKLDRGLEIEVSFSMGDRRFAQLRSYLTRMLDEGVLAATCIPEQADTPNRRTALSVGYTVGSACWIGYQRPFPAAVGDPQR